LTPGLAWTEKPPTWPSRCQPVTNTYPPTLLPPVLQPTIAPRSMPTIQHMPHLCHGSPPTPHHAWPPTDPQLYRPLPCQIPSLHRFHLHLARVHCQPIGQLPSPPLDSPTAPFSWPLLVSTPILPPGSCSTAPSLPGLPLLEPCNQPPSPTFPVLVDLTGPFPKTTLYTLLRPPTRGVYRKVFQSPGDKHIPLHRPCFNPYHWI